MKRQNISVTGIQGYIGTPIADIETPYICIWADGLIIGAHTWREMEQYLTKTNGTTIKRKIFEFVFFDELAENLIKEITDIVR